MIPPIDEQKKISNYLDQKVSQIDDLIQNKQELIDLLKEQRISVICSAVTKGIDSTAEMKDSGNEWLGYIRKLENCSGKGIVCSKQRNPPRNRCSANRQPKVRHYLPRRLHGAAELQNCFGR